MPAISPDKSSTSTVEHTPSDRYEPSLSSFGFRPLSLSRQAPSRRVWIGIGVVLLATFMGQVDMFIVNVASPAMQEDLQADFSQIQLIIDGYVVAYAAGMVAGGKLGDLIGRKRVFAYGVLAFTVASVLCAACTTANQLIGARILQGAAAAMVMPQVLSIIQSTFSQARDRQRAIGVYGAVIGLGVIAGLIGGGLLLQWNVAGLEWRTIFLINVPIGVAILLAVPTVKESRGPEGARLDLVGAALTALALPALLVPLSLGPEHGWPMWTLLCFPLFALLVLGLVYYERRLDARGGDPLLPPWLFRPRGFRISMLAVIVFFSGNAGFFLVLTYHLQSGLDLGPMGTGLVFVPLGLGFTIASLVSRSLMERYGTRVLITGAVMMAIGYGVMPAIVHADRELQLTLLAAVIGLGGIGQGLIVSPLTSIVMAQVPTAALGAGSGVLNTMTQAAMALGVAVVGALYRIVLGANPQDAGGAMVWNDFASAFAATCLLLGVLAVIMTVLIRLLRGTGQPQAVPETESVRSG
ncbi:MFS transporter [Nocardia sp. NPDC058499]|uniref:MFS transporter n=1 Tax=Nocardia sp. NPDC058499 TaxID=3346530 RepID=UPI00364F87C2